MADLRAQLQQTVGRKFRVIRELTAGGMSRVFLADEIELEREVAIKVLSPSLVDDALRARFRQEVLQTARLQHPSIVPLLDVGTVRDEDGTELPFYVMPYVRGESVRSRLSHEHQLSIGLTIRVVRNVLEALAHAHAMGVIHRDVKPENIFLSGSNAVLADFGIAKTLRGNTKEDKLTSPGSAVGSPAYMAPEQLTADDDVDHRADIYAVGAVAFEMLAGRLPWEGRTSSERLASRAKRQLARLRSLRPDAPFDLEALLERCLAWDPAERPQSAAEVLRELEPIKTPSTSSFPVITGARRLTRAPRTRWALAVAGAGLLVAVAASRWFTPPRSPQPVRLAVLFPEVVSTVGATALDEQLYHHLVSSLAPVAGLKLVGEVSVPELHGRGVTARQMADSLDVDSALVMRTIEGTGGSYLLSIELQQKKAKRSEIVAGPISITSFSNLKPDSVRTLVKQLSGQVVSRLALLSTNSTVPQTQMLDSWIAWSKGHDAFGRRTPEGFREAVMYFERATRLDTAYAQAYAELATVLATSLFYQYRIVQDSPYDVATRALRLANRATQLQPTYADGYLARAYVGTVTGAPKEFLEKNFGEAKRLSSSNTYWNMWYAALYAARNEFGQALSQLHDDALADPRSPAKQAALGLYALPGKEYITAVRAAQNLRKLQPDIPVAGRIELWGRLLLGGRALDECANVQPGPYLGVYALCLDATHRAAEAGVLTDSLFRIVTGKAPMDSNFDLSLYMAEMASYYAGKKEYEAAQQWLRQTFAESPNGFDRRYMQAAIFPPALAALGDSLRAQAWERVSRGASAGLSAESVRAIKTIP